MARAKHAVPCGKGLQKIEARDVGFMGLDMWSYLSVDLCEYRATQAFMRHLSGC